MVVLFEKEPVEEAKGPHLGVRSQAVCLSWGDHQVYIGSEGLGIVRDEDEPSLHRFLAGWGTDLVPDSE